jgi:hypothetical protein
MGRLGPDSALKPTNMRTVTAATLPRVFRACAAGAAIGASLAFTAVPAAADATDASAGAPITIDRCTVDEASALANPKFGLHTSYAAGIAIGYTNERDAAATEVRFGVRYAGKTLTFVDRGTFAAHAKQRHEFTKFTAVYNGANVDCRVVSVSFADGSRWDAPDQPPAPAAAH